MMLAIVGTVTTNVALPATPSTVAVIETVPPATAVTTPSEETIATVEFDVDQATDRPVMALPSASATLAVA